MYRQGFCRKSRWGSSRVYTAQIKGEETDAVRNAQAARDRATKVLSSEGKW